MARSKISKDVEKKIKMLRFGYKIVNRSKVETVVKTESIKMFEFDFKMILFFTQIAKPWIQNFAILSEKKINDQMS